MNQKRLFLGLRLLLLAAAMVTTHATQADPADPSADTNDTYVAPEASATPTPEATPTPDDYPPTDEPSPYGGDYEAPEEPEDDPYYLPPEDNNYY